MMSYQAGLKKKVLLYISWKQAVVIHPFTNLFSVSTCSWTQGHGCQQSFGEAKMIKYIQPVFLETRKNKPSFKKKT